MDGDLTPMMQQYRRAKAEAGDALLFFRLGDFYELFHDDARTASRVLDITLTARGREGGEGGYPMCGVPHHAADGYVARLVQAGFKVALCDQVEDPKVAKGIVKRAIVRILTPSTATDDRSLPAHESSFLTAILQERGRIGLAHVDISTGEVRISERDPATESALVAIELAAVSPREILLPEGADDVAMGGWSSRGRAPAVTRVDAATFSRSSARERIAERWRVGSLAGFGLDARPAATRALGAALAYLEHATRASLAHLEPPRLHDDALTVGIDASTRRNLEILETLHDGSREGTLAWVLDRTRTPMGSRTLRSWLVAPLRDVAAMSERHDAVEDLIAASAGGTAPPDLEGMGDLERILARCGMGSASPRDLANLGSAMSRLPAVKERLVASRSELLARLGADVDPQAELAAALASTLVEAPPLSSREGGLVREGFSPELDELRTLATDARAHLAALETRERERTGISSLKVRHNKVFGYYLEVSQSHLGKVPPEWQRRQTLANAERYATPELKDLEGRVLHAQERSVEIEREIFERLRERCAGASEPLRRTARALGVLDALASFAHVAAAGGYVRPVVEESTILRIRAGRHPVVEAMRIEPLSPAFGSGRFVPNDTDLSADERQIAILTGPNMGGKSTYLRQVALITLMAQAGSFVPAESAVIGVVDRIFTRVGASDHLATGQSTFMVEMTETARILNEATRRSLVVLDEIGRGTSTFDGLSIAWAVAEHLHESPRVAARTLFATHYHEMTELATLYPRVRNLRLATREWQGEIVFLHRVEEGAGDRSYGIQVARLAGLPPGVIARAKEVLENLQRTELDPSGAPRLAQHGSGPATRRLPATVAPQLPLFGEAPADPRLRALVERLAAADVDGLSPRAALDLLAELRDASRDALG